MTADTELRRLAALATPGPWTLDEPRESFMLRCSIEEEKMMHSIDGPKCVSDYEDWGFCQTDGAYMAAADPTTVTALLERLERAEAVLAQIAALRRYDPNAGRSCEGNRYTLHVPGEVVSQMDAALLAAKSLMVKP